MATTRTSASTGSSAWWVLGVIGAVFALTALVHLAAVITPIPDPAALSWNPLELVLQLATGEPVPAAALPLVLIAAAGITALGAWAWWRTGTGEQRRGMSTHSRLRGVQESARRREAEQLHPDFDRSAVPGLRIGKLTGPGGWLIQGFRQCAVHVWGPGRGKTTGEVIRHAAEAPGPFMVTMNKLDGIREILAVRAYSRLDGRVWMFDQQQMFRRSEVPAFTFDPLSTVHSTEDASDLASLFEAAGAAEDAKRDAQFDSQGRDYLAWCMFAAALDGKYLHDVYGWVSKADFGEPQGILSSHGAMGPAAALLGMSEQPDRTRGSVAASAQRMASPMVHDRLMAWTRPHPGVPVFDPARFVESTDTLVMLSSESGTTVTAFVSALVEAVFNAGQRSAQRNGNRLAVPVVADLDECGNVVKLKKLPDWYTYFGSLGIVISAYFQSPAQGEATFGAAGWKQLWDAAGVRVYGGGVDDDAWLRQLSALFGRVDERIVNPSRGPRGEHSSSSTVREREVWPVSDLANLPEWRALVRTANGVSAMVEVVPAFRDRQMSAVLAAEREASDYATGKSLA